MVVEMDTHSTIYVGSSSNLANRSRCALQVTSEYTDVANLLLRHGKENLQIF